MRAEVVALALALFMARVFTQNAHDVLAFDDLARFTQSFYRCSNFHSFWALQGTKKPHWKTYSFPERLSKSSLTFAGRLFALSTSRKGTFLAELCRLARCE